MHNSYLSLLCQLAAGNLKMLAALACYGFAKLRQEVTGGYSDQELSDAKQDVAMAAVTVAESVRGLAYRAGALERMQTDEQAPAD